jgi:4-carboxymuconolactone decarboxylase
MPNSKAPPKMADSSVPSTPLCSTPPSLHPFWTCNSLSARVREVVILAVGAVWQADYELYAHLAVARKAGLSEDAARAVATGRLPDGLSNNELIALRLTQQLSTSHRVDESLYREAETAFGTKGLIDIAFLIGIYHSVCATLIMFAIPAPE